MMPVPSATQWGSPAASKRALLIHGNTCSSLTWETVAQSLAKAGFFVVAPNMLGHGHRPADEFYLQTFAQDLYATYFANGSTYDVIIGHSLGGSVALALLPLLPVTRDPKNGKALKTTVILVDPGIELSNRELDEFETRFADEIQRVPSVDTYMAAHPRWTRQDAVSRVVGLHMARSEIPRRIFEVRRDHCSIVPFPLGVQSNDWDPEHIKPFAYRHLFSAMPSHVEMTVLVADPKLGGICPPELVPAHPQIRRVVTVKGCSHWIQHEDPDVIVKTAVDAVDSLRAHM